MVAKDDGQMIARIGCMVERGGGRGGMEVEQVMLFMIHTNNNICELCCSVVAFGYREGKQGEWLEKGRGVAGRNDGWVGPC